MNYANVQRNAKDEYKSIACPEENVESHQWLTWDFLTPVQSQIYLTLFNQTFTHPFKFKSVLVLSPQKIDWCFENALIKMSVSKKLPLPFTLSFAQLPFTLCNWKCKRQNLDWLAIWLRVVFIYAPRMCVVILWGHDDPYRRFAYNSVIAKIARKPDVTIPMNFDVWYWIWLFL